MNFKEFFKNKPAKYVLSVLLLFCIVFTFVYLIVDFNSNKLGMTPFLLPFKEEKVFASGSNDAVQTEFRKNKILVTIDLKKFGNNKDNIKTEYIENGIKISGVEKSEKNGTVSQISFDKKIIIPGKISPEKVKQTQKGDKYIITIPLN